MSSTLSHELSDHAVHLWTVDLSDAPSYRDHLKTILSRDERDRVECLHFPNVRDKFLASRALLRILAAGYLGREAKELSFLYSADGKPRLCPHSGSLEFNVSHSGSLASYAFARGCPVGVDIELVRELRGRDVVARKYFALSEYQEFARLPEEAKLLRFFQCWTRKEAFVKALGSGFSFALDRFQVTIGTESGARIVHVDNSQFEASEWCVYDFSPIQGYAGALAYRVCKRKIQHCISSILSILRDFNRSGPSY